MSKTISEILIEADATNDLNELSKAWKYICDNKYDYPLSEIYFAKEHLGNLAIEMAKRDIKLLKPVLDLLK